MQNIQRSIAEIDLIAIKKNIKVIKSYLKETTKLCLVLKANAYGHGAREVAKFCETLNVDYFAVAIIEEAIELRLNGIKKPILILSPIPYSVEAVKKCIEYRLELTIFDYHRLELLNMVASQYNVKAKIHIAIDTGMKRIGIMPNDALNFVQTAIKCKNIEVVGMSSHFFASDAKSKITSEKQYKEFCLIIEELKKQRIEIPICHICNSAATIELSKYQLDMVRCGIVFYGIHPMEKRADCIKLNPVMRLKSTVSFIKQVEMGSTIGYGGSYVTKRNSIIATVSIGYADGVPRALSNKGCVMVLGSRAPIVGRICMDQLMIDVTDIPNVAIGDEVTIFGDETLLIEEVSKLAGTIPHEILCNIDKRIPRKYLK